MESDTGIINLNGPGRSFRNGEFLDLSWDLYFIAFPIHSQYSFDTCIALIHVRLQEAVML